MSKAMGGDKDAPPPEFMELCAQALIALRQCVPLLLLLVTRTAVHTRARARRNTSLLVNLFLLMLPAGMPELASKEDINYLRDKLAPTLSDDDTVKVFTEEVKNALGDVRKRLDNTVHNFVHPG